MISPLVSGHVLGAGDTEVNKEGQWVWDQGGQLNSKHLWAGREAID